MFEAKYISLPTRSGSRPSSRKELEDAVTQDTFRGPPHPGDAKKQVKAIVAEGYTSGDK